MPTTGATMMTTTQASRDAGSRCGRSSARPTKKICKATWVASSSHAGRWPRLQSQPVLMPMAGGRAALSGHHLLGGGEPELRPVAGHPVDVPLQPRHVDRIPVVVLGHVALVRLREGLDPFARAGEPAGRGELRRLEA